MRTRIIAFSSRGCALASRICAALDDCEYYGKTIGDEHGAVHVGSVDDWTRESFELCDAIVFVGAAGIAVRHVAPYLRNKTVDPAVIVVDELGMNVIPILSGHIGGANRLAGDIAGRIGARLIITTATDINGMFSVDTYATENGMYIGHLPVAKYISARILEGMPVHMTSDFDISGEIPRGITLADRGDIGIRISSSRANGPFGRTLKLIPRHMTLGIGCRRGTDMRSIERLVMDVLRENDISLRAVRCAGSIDLKRDEPGLLQFCAKYGIPVTFFTKEELEAVEGEFTESGRVRSVTGVGNVCERSAVAVSDGGTLAVRKTARDGVTVAVASEPYTVRFGGA